jgi:hypothetical protein
MDMSFHELRALLNASDNSRQSDDHVFIEIPANRLERTKRITLAITPEGHCTAEHRIVIPTIDGPKDVVMSRQKWLKNTPNIGKKLDLWGKINDLRPEVVEYFKNSVLRKKGILTSDDSSSTNSSTGQSHSAAFPEDDE